MSFNPFSIFNNGEKVDTSTEQRGFQAGEAKEDSTIVDVSPHEVVFTYKKYGFMQSRNHGASPISFENELHKVFEIFRKEVARNEEEQERGKIPIRAKLESLKIDKDSSGKKIAAIKNDLIPELKKKVQALKDEIGNIRRDPSQYRKEKPNKVAFVFGVVIGFLLTVYLWIFYTSASYSAFFRKFDANDIVVANSIFDAAALAKAYNDGIPAFVLVVSMPFIFLALGFLIHKFSQDKSKWRYLHLGLLIIVTLLFDYVIAFEIVKKVYELQVAASLETMPPYSFSMAIVDMNFWLIIFAGFVTYLIWGFLFDKMMEEYEKFDVVKVQIKLREAEIAELQKELKTQLALIDELDGKIAETEKQIKATEEDLNAIIIKPKDFERVIYQFTSGWLQFIEGGLVAKEEKKNEMRVSIVDTTSRFIASNTITAPNV